MHVFADLDACVAPVLSPAEAPGHPHNASRGTFLDVGGDIQPAPAPRFARTPAAAPRPAPDPVGDLMTVSAIVDSWPLAKAPS
jgi:alpha-methylacyl-CoA racemase